MQKTFILVFLYSSGVLLIVTGMAKLIGSFGIAHVLQHRDPLLFVTFQNTFRVVGLIEFTIAIICLFGKQVAVKAGLVAWLATMFVWYHFGLWWINYQQPCNCLGHLTDALHISPETTDKTMKVILAYLFLGSYATLFWIWNGKRKTSAD